ncbi:nucleotide exchange factor GrpE [Halomonas llamarensis]|uniref:Nucleotide exchange factor GrpE n=1 Tax=Halomonas llamarensis TaxID=2945104 RepID=A0ABT0SQA5_9GAMM|nr:nucleotide exchange factor GrpE [Halomonas llamarensis]MCL7929758.1 nucleotide exchange factor GrpE [Halomonas llamarensis]
MDKDQQEQLLERFRTYLQTPGSQETDEQALDAPDLFSLLAELAALKSEVKIESRQFKTALEQFRELFDRLEQDKSRLEQQLSQQSAQHQAQQREQERDLLLEMIDLRDRLQAGHTQAQRYTPGWLARRSDATTFVRGMAQGMAMNLERLDGILTRREVRPVQSLGQPFDPHTMQAADIAYDVDRPEGEVLDELRPGYWHGTRLLRLAEVIVNKPPVPDTHTSH